MKSAQLIKCLADWNCTIEYQCNWNATGNSQEIKEYVEAGIAIRLHNRGNHYFIEERKIGVGNIYPTIYKVSYTPQRVVEITDEDYENWLAKK